MIKARKKLLAGCKLCLALVLPGCSTFPEMQQLPLDASLAEVEAKNPESDATANLLRVASDIEARGSVATALPFYQRAAAAPGASAETHVKLGNAYAKLNRLQEAEQSYRTALETSSDHGEALLGLGGVLIRLGRAEDGIIVLTEAAPIVNNAGVYDRLGVAHIALAQPREALASFEQAHAMAADDTDITSNLALSAALSGQYDRALALARSLAKSSDLENYHRRNLVLIMTVSGAAGEARQIAAGGLDPSVVDTLVMKGKKLREIDSPRDRALALGNGNSGIAAQEF